MNTKRELEKLWTMNGRAAAAFLAVSVIGASASLRADDISQYGDSDISDAVEDELMLDAIAPYNSIDITTSEGIVTLDGETSNILAKERAAILAETVAGVRSVVNMIDVNRIIDMDGSDLADRVRAALMADPAADSYELTVKANDKGKVTLKGKVDSFPERQLSEIVAKGVAGVTDVSNQISVAYKANRLDYEIEADIERLLEWDALVDDHLIEVAVNDGQVVLTGVVGSAAERRRAGNDARVSGVKGVDTGGLRVEPWAEDRDQRDAEVVLRDDSSIRDALTDALAYDPRVFSFDINPEVSEGWVTLRGEVDNLKAKRAAESVARRTVAVTGVTNRIKVRPDDSLTQEDIVSNVEFQLSISPWLNSLEIDVDSILGTVYLRGVVDSRFEKLHAETVAGGAEGVKEVVNYLTVSDENSVVTYDPYLWSYNPIPWSYYPYAGPDALPSVTMNDSDILDSIESELLWSPFVDSDDVNVKVDNGVATLSGNLDSQNEIDAAVENAWEGGALVVVNDLTTSSEQ